MKIFLFAVALLWSTFGVSQKTYFINTERETESLIIDGQNWTGQAFFTVESEKPLIQVIVKEQGYKDEYDILHEDTNHRYTANHFINVDTNIISIIKPLQLHLDKGTVDFQTNTLDLATFLKDLDHDGALLTYEKMPEENEILQSLTLSVDWLTKETNEYHNNTIGRYRFYMIATVKSIRLYEVGINEDDRFIQAYIDADWSITGKNTEDLPIYNHLGQSGKIVFSRTDLSTSEVVSKAVHDALLDSMFYFMEEQEPKIAKALSTN